MKSTSSRQNLIGIICGNRGVGKSTYLLEMITNHPKKVLIFDLDDNPLYHQFQKITPEMLPHWKKGIKRIILPDVDLVFEAITEYCYNTLILFEDATKYIERDPPKTVKQLVLASKQRNLDILFTFHTYRSIPPKLLSWADVLEVFKTGENIELFKKKIPLFEQVAKVYQAVSQHPNRFHHQSIRLR